MATPEQIDQQRRIINAARAEVLAFLEAAARLQSHAATYNRIGLSGQLLDDTAFDGTGTTKTAYRDAITSIGAVDALMLAGNGTNLETFAR